MPAGFPKFRFIYKWYEKLQCQVVIKLSVILIGVTFFGLLIKHCYFHYLLYGIICLSFHCWLFYFGRIIIIIIFFAYVLFPYFFFFNRFIFTLIGE